MAINNLLALGLNEEQIKFLAASPVAKELVQKGWLAEEDLPKKIIKKINKKLGDGTYETVHISPFTKYIYLEDGGNVQDLLTWTEI